METHGLRTASSAGQVMDVYLQELMHDEDLLEVLGVSGAEAARCLLVLEALSVNALWDFGIPFEQVRPCQGQYADMQK